jgi:hypothetical protein
MIFSTVKPRFLETIGRQRATSFAELDTLVCKFTGPTASSDNVPTVGSYHPQYPGMQAQGVRKVGIVAGMTELEITYKGKLEASTQNFVGQTLIDISASQQELTYQTRNQTLAVIIAAPTPSHPNGTFQYKISSRSWALLYMGLTTTIRYVCRPRPLAPKFESLATMAIIDQTTRFTGESAATYVIGDPNIHDDPLAGVVFDFKGPELYCSTFNATGITPDWYQVTETWTTRYFISK